MTQDLIRGKYRGIPLFEKNPSVPNPDAVVGRRRKKIGDDKRGILLDGHTGEIIGQAGAAFYEIEECDQERFVKLFLNGIKKTIGLSRAGLQIFELVYHQVRETPNSDEVKLSIYRAQDRIEGITERTYQRGVRELLEREILFRSTDPGTFFINIGVMFNGNRLLFIKGYHLNNGKKQQKKTISAKVDDPQGSLPL